MREVLMNKKEDRFTFSAHALERGLERMLGKEAPYEKIDYHRIKALVVKEMEWNEYGCIWQMTDYKLELIIKNGECVTIAPTANKVADTYSGTKPISEYKKQFSKKCMKSGRSESNHKRGLKDK